MARGTTSGQTTPQWQTYDLCVFKSEKRPLVTLCIYDKTAHRRPKKNLALKVFLLCMNTALSCFQKVFFCVLHSCVKYVESLFFSSSKDFVYIE